MLYPKIADNGNINVRILKKHREKLSDVVKGDLREESIIFPLNRLRFAFDLEYWMNDMLAHIHTIAKDHSEKRDDDSDVDKQETLWYQKFIMVYQSILVMEPGMCSLLEKSITDNESNMSANALYDMLRVSLPDTRLGKVLRSVIQKQNVNYADTLAKIVGTATVELNLIDDCDRYVRTHLLDKAISNGHNRDTIHGHTFSQHERHTITWMLVLKFWFPVIDRLLTYCSGKRYVFYFFQNVMSVIYAYASENSAERQLVQSILNNLTATWASESLTDLFALVANTGSKEENKRVCIGLYHLVCLLYVNPKNIPPILNDNDYLRQVLINDCFLMQCDPYC